jgi:hypothetical protein
MWDYNADEDGFCAISVSNGGPLGAVTQNCPNGVGPSGGRYAYPYSDWDNFGIGPCFGPYSDPPI